VTDHQEPADDELTRALARAISASWKGAWEFFARDASDAETRRLALLRARRLLILFGRVMYAVDEADGDDEEEAATEMVPGSIVARGFADYYIIMAGACDERSPWPNWAHRDIMGNAIRAHRADTWCERQGYELDLSDVPDLAGFGGDDVSDTPSPAELSGLFTSGNLGAYRVTEDHESARLDAAVAKFVAHFRDEIALHGKWMQYLTEADAYAEIDRRRGELRAYWTRSLIDAGLWQRWLTANRGPTEAALAAGLVNVAAETMVLMTTATGPDDLMTLPLITSRLLDDFVDGFGVRHWLDENTPAPEQLTED
jgi:hypothetical protein